MLAWMNFVIKTRFRGEIMSAAMLCPYCRGNQFWGPETDDDPAMTVEIEEGKLFVRHMLQDEDIEIPINFCPICGRKLDN